MPNPPAFLNLQNAFYNGLVAGLNLPPTNTFQLLQPSTPLVDSTVPNKSDQALWNYFNAIPPMSLTNNYIASGNNQFFSNYKGVISALVAPRSTFVADIGESTYDGWLIYVSSLANFPTRDQLPDLFANWGSVFAPEVADIGSQDLAAMLLDPISAAGLALMPYAKVSGAQAPDWTLGYADLINQLEKGAQTSFTFNSRTQSSDVSKTWSGGSNSGFFGLWGGSSYTESTSETFASAAVQMTASFDHVITFSATPGNWYSSAAFSNAYSQQGSPPWKPGSTISWNGTFGSNGNLQNFLTNLVVVSGMKISLTTLATFTSDQQSTVNNNSSNGLWPFYSSGNSSGMNTSHHFNSDGSLTVDISSKGGVPIVIGGNVIPASQMLGAQNKAQERFLAMTGARQDSDER